MTMHKFSVEITQGNKFFNILDNIEAHDAEHACDLVRVHYSAHPLLEYYAVQTDVENYSAPKRERNSSNEKRPKKSKSERVNKWSD